MIIGCHNHPIRKSQNAFHLLVVNILFVRQDSSLWIDVGEMSLDHIHFMELVLSVLVVCSYNPVQVRHFQDIGIDEIDLMEPHMDEMFCDNRSPSTHYNDGDDLVMHNRSHHIQPKHQCTPIEKAFYCCHRSFFIVLIRVLVEVRTGDVLWTRLRFEQGASCNSRAAAERPYSCRVPSLREH